MHPDAPYFSILICLTQSILLCLTPDNFTHQVESAATQWVKERFILIISSNNSKLVGLVMFA
jgi:hypothetical protein